MNTNEATAPCGICGGQVRERLVKGQMSMADVTPPIEVVRVCQNPKCRSNTRDMSLADVV
jgi:hypothetical protein